MEKNTLMRNLLIIPLMLARAACFVTRAMGDDTYLRHLLIKLPAPVTAQGDRRPRITAINC